MIDPQARLGAYVRLLALVVVLGLICALITFGFMALVHGGTVLDLGTSLRPLWRSTRAS